MLEEKLSMGWELPLIGKLAFLKHVCEGEEPIRMRQRMMGTRYMQELAESELVFAFFWEFGKKVGISSLPAVLRNKTILEYRTDEGKQVDVCTASAERMDSVYDGIYGKLFVLFQGEKMPYRIIVREGGRQVVEAEGVLERVEGYGQEDDSAFGLLDTMSVEAGEAGNESLVLEMMRNYVEKRYLVEEYTRSSYME
jgi:hypothetical protein